jgi:Leucine-rich repeat (LRR) protein
LNVNRLTGSLPTSCWATLAHLKTLNLEENRLVGAIPALGSFIPLLEYFLVNSNHLTGYLPPSLGLLTNLLSLDVTTNNLNGTLPIALCSLTAVETLELGDNGFTGTIPACFGNLTAMANFDVQSNQLHGLLPASLSQIPQLGYFSASVNYFSGTIPSFLCDYANITGIYLGLNLFTGSLPNCLSNLTTLTNIGTEYNTLTGTIPQGLLLLPNLLTVWLDGDGDLYGPITCSGTSLVRELLLDDNKLSGTIPDTVSTTAIRYLGLSSNLFTGTIPYSLGYMSMSEVIYLSGNLLTGSLPTSFISLLNLFQIDVHDNFIGGSLDGVFNPAEQIRLLDILVHQNQLTGTLPGEIFQLQRLNTFIATENCFTGSIPEEACSNKVMISLVLDGLHTSKACRKHLLPAPANAYGIANDFQGTVPACLLQHARLTSLHLSGNGLTGTLPSNITIHPHLLDLTLSHNALTGTIPVSIQSHNWRTLDLSYNRLSGVLESDFAAALGHTVERLENSTRNSSDHSIHIENNRLSGGVPQPLMHLQNVASLGSNMFSCKVDKNDLPRHDSDKANYQCGSDAFNGPFYVFIIICSLALVVAALAWLYLYSGFAGLRSTVQKWALDVENTPRTVMYVDAASDILCQLGVWCTVLIVLVLMPWYAAASHYYGTYTHQYAWVVSAAFLSGVTPLAVNFTFYCALMIALVISAGLIVVKKDREERHRSRSRSSSRLSKQSTASTAAVATALPLWRRTLVYSAFLLLNLVVVVGVNAAFVIIALTQSSGALIVAQVALSVFKLLWNTVCTPFLIYLARGYVARTNARASLVTVQVFIGLFNNIAIPCLVVAVLSPSCFYSVFDPPGKVTSNFAVQGCYIGAVVFVCSFVDVIRQSTSFSPPFKYDYQCSSSFVTYYAPAFVYLGLAAAFAAPLVKIAGMHLLHRASPGTRWHSVLAKLVPRILKPPKIGQGKIASADALTHSVDSDAPVGEFALGLWERYRPIFDANNFIIALITYLGILLTFGVVFPPLAVVMCATMLSVAGQTKLEVGRYLCNAREAGTLHLAEGIEKECRGAVSMEKLRRSLFMTICFCCGFYALFLFDTLGNDVGLHQALWVLYVMSLFPFVLYGAIRAHRYFYPDADAQLGYSVDDNLSEMRARAESEGAQTLAVPMATLSANGQVVAAPPRADGGDKENVTFNAMLEL